MSINQADEPQVARSDNPNSCTSDHKKVIKKEVRCTKVEGCPNITVIGYANLTQADFFLI